MSIFLIAHGNKELSQNNLQKIQNMQVISWQSLILRQYGIFPLTYLFNLFAARVKLRNYFTFSQLWLPTVQDVLQADWQEVW